MVQMVAVPKLAWLWLVLAIFFRLAITPLDLYRSTDFEVHRNWLAITYTLPVSKWYYEDTSPWTLDYPPFFAVFEWILSQLAGFVDTDMLTVSNLNYSSWATVVFQRCSVAAGDVVLFYGALRLASVLSGSPTLGAKFDAIITATAVVLSTPGLLIVDHVHFQYNGMLLGLLLASIADVEDGRIYRGAALFSILLNMKQIFLYAAPVYFLYLLRGHCGCTFGSGHIGVRFKFKELVKLGSTVVGVFAVAWVPLIGTGQATQAISRLFPFGRGLTHAYWAPNVWALYNTVDRILAKFGFGEQTNTKSSTAGFAEVFESSVLPTISPKICFALTMLAYVPLAILIWRQTPPELTGTCRPSVGRGRFALYTALGSAVSFAFGWHVHEKAILMITVPLLATVSNAAGEKFGVGDKLRQAALALSAIGTFSLLPLLPQRPMETTFKWIVFIVGVTIESKLLLRSKDDGIASMFAIRPFSGWLVLFGMVFLGIYADFGLHGLVFKGRMEFLPLLLISDFSAVLVLACFVRIFRLAQLLE